MLKQGSFAFSFVMTVDEDRDNIFFGGALEISPFSVLVLLGEMSSKFPRLMVSTKTPKTDFESESFSSSIMIGVQTAIFQRRVVVDRKGALTWETEVGLIFLRGTVVERSCRFPLK